LPESVNSLPAFYQRIERHIGKSTALANLLDQWTSGAKAPNALKVFAAGLPRPPEKPWRLNSGKTLDFDERPDFDGAPAASGNAGGDIDGFIEVPGVNQKEAAELLAGFGKGAVSYQALTIVEAKAGGGRGGLERGRTEELPFLVELIGESGGFDVAVLALLLCKCSIFIKIH